MSNSTIPCRFAKNVMQNGIGRHVCQLQRLTISFCKEHNNSKGTRDFIENHLLDFTKVNPGTVVYLKPRRHRKPYLQAVYLNGCTETITIAGESEALVCEWVGQLKGRTGVQIQRLVKNWHTHTPSIQGVWHPFLFKDTLSSVADFMEKCLHEFTPPRKTATENLLNFYDENEQSDNTVMAEGQAT